MQPAIRKYKHILWKYKTRNMELHARCTQIQARNMEILRSYKGKKNKTITFCKVIVHAHKVTNNVMNYPKEHALSHLSILLYLLLFFYLISVLKFSNAALHQEMLWSVMSQHAPLVRFEEILMKRYKVCKFGNNLHMYTSEQKYTLGFLNLFFFL